MSQPEIPTDRSIQMNESNIQTSHQPPITFTHSNYYIEKMSSHLEFIEAEFIKNMHWQKQILNQIKNEGQKGGKQRSMYNLNKDSQSLKLKPDQQRLLKIILSAVIGQDRQEIPLKEMIRLAAITLSKKQHQSPVYTFSQAQKIQQQPLKFPVLQRVITLNDLAPSTRRQLTASPSLPPRTPKSKPSKQTQNKKAKQLFTPPYQPQKCQNDISSIQKNDLRVQSEVKQDYNKRKEIELPMQDSLGKRLFQDNQDKLIYIKDSSEEDISLGSEVSLNLSQSNFGKQLHIQSSDLNNSRCLSFHNQIIQEKPFKQKILFQLNNYTPQNCFKNEKVVDETLYLRMYNDFEGSNKKSSKQVAEQGSVEGLCFGGHPKRKIGKCVIKKENYFAYQQNSSSSIRKMHDSFGLAYQQYYSDGPNYVKEECIYQCRNTMEK